MISLTSSVCKTSNSSRPTLGYPNIHYPIGMSESRTKNASGKAQPTQIGTGPRVGGAGEGGGGDEGEGGEGEIGTSKGEMVSNSTFGQTAPKRTAAYPKTVDRLINELAALPGIGRRSAERLAFYLLKSEEKTALSLAQAITDVKRTVRHCDVCWNLSDGTRCDICTDSGRDRSTVLVVEQPRDLIALELTGMYKGLYHVLMGRLSPLDGIGPAELTVKTLMERLDNPQMNPGQTPVSEVILGLNPTLEGDGTALYLSDLVKARHIKLTRLARGLPTGSQLEFANKAVLADAIEGRQSLQ